MYTDQELYGRLINSGVTPMGQHLMALQRQTAGACRQLLAYLASTGPAKARTWLWYRAVRGMSLQMRALIYKDCHAK